MPTPTPSSTKPSTPRGTKLALGIILLCVALGARAFFAYTAEDPLRDYTGRMAVVEGTVANDPEQRATALDAYIDVEKINGLGAHGRVLAQLPREEDLAYGDTVAVRGVIETPQSFETDTGRTFDYPGYLRVRGVTAVMPHAALRESTAGGWSLQRSLYSLKHAFEHSLEKVFAEPRVSLLEGLLLGERRGLPTALTQAFIVSGLIHVVVLSGYNIAVVSDFVLRLMGAVMRKKYALATGAAVIILFALMAGGGAATVRACLMGLIAVLARYLNRPAAALRALGVAAGAMLLWNPLVLMYDPGFVLSILATFGLITIAPSIEPWLTWLPSHKKFDLRGIAATTIAVQLFVLPALLYYTGILSVVALPANLLALPVVSFAMLFGFIAGLVGLVHPLLALAPMLAADALLRWMIGVAQVAARLPLASFVVPTFPAWLAALAYAPLTLLAIRLYRRSVSAPPH